MSSKPSTVCMVFLFIYKLKVQQIIFPCNIILTIIIYANFPIFNHLYLELPQTHNLTISSLGELSQSQTFHFLPFFPPRKTQTFAHRAPFSKVGSNTAPAEPA